MGGYNTFCEILSFDKRALIVPRTTPRLEQFIRAVGAPSDLGLVEMLRRSGRDPARMATALRQLPQQGACDDVVVPGPARWARRVSELAQRWLADARTAARPPCRSAAE